MTMEDETKEKKEGKFRICMYVFCRKKRHIYMCAGMCIAL